MLIVGAQIADDGVEVVQLALVLGLVKLLLIVGYVRILAVSKMLYPLKEVRDLLLLLVKLAILLIQVIDDPD